MKQGVIIFDMDGVLVDVTESYRETIIQTVRHFTGQQISRELVQNYKNAGGWNNDWALSHQIARDLGVEIEYDTVVERFQKFFLGNGANGLIERERWIASEGALEGLSHNYDLAIFTGRPRDEVHITLRRFVSGYAFDPIVADEDVINSKPHPEGLLKIAAKFPDRKLWYIGDTVDDARSARAAGIPFFGVAAVSPHQQTLKTLLMQEGAIAVIDDINQLEGVLPA